MIIDKNILALFIIYFVVIRTNSSSTNILLNPYVDSTDSTKGDHISFYGRAGQITGPKDEDGNYTGFTVAFNSIAINGKVVGLKAASGHIDLTNAVVEEDEEIIILATTTDVKVSNPNKVSTHAHATSESNANAMNDPVDTTKKSIGVIWDYDGNVAQNEIDDIHHHITDAQAEAAGEDLGTGPIDGGGEWNYEEVVEEVAYVTSNKEVSENASYVARIGGQGYETLAAAVTAAVNGDTIVMLKDDLLTGTVNITKKISLDLNGKQVGRVVATLTTALLLSNGELTINDSIGTGSVLANAQAIGMTNSNDKLIINDGNIQGATYGVRIQKGDSVVINGGRIIGGSAGYGIFNQAAKSLSVSNANISGAYAIQTKSANAEITISNSELTGTSYGINSTATATITVSESTISATNSNSYAIQSTGGNSNVTVENSTISGGNRAINSSQANSSVTVKSGTFSGGTYGVVNTGTLTIEDGTIQANLYYGVSNSGTLNMNGGTIIGGTHESYGRGIYNTGTTTINGGTISMNAQTANLQVAIDNRKTLTMNGGNVISNVIGVYSTDLFTLADGTITGGTNGIQTFGTTNITGGEIHCENDICVNVAGGSLTIDNGKLYGAYGIYAQNNPTIAINGENVRVEALKCVWLNSNTATCSISAGTFVGGSEVCYAYEGFFTISGGTFTGSGTTQYEDDIYRFTLNCKDEKYTGSLAGYTVTGGTFYQFNPQNNQAEGAGTDFTSGDVTVTYNESTGYYTVVENN